MAEEIQDLDLCSSTDASQSGSSWSCGYIAIFEVSYHE